MNVRQLVIAVAVLGVAGALAAGPALAGKKGARYHKVRVARCVDAPREFSFWDILDNPKPRPNGCAPAVYNYGKYIGQDPDPFIRQQMLRDSATGYSGELAR